MGARKIYSKTALVASANSRAHNLRDLIDEAGEFVATVQAQNVGGTLPTFDVSLQHSPDGVVWSAFITAAADFTQLDADGSESIKVQGPCHSLVRAAITVGGTAPTADIDVWVEGNQG